MIAPEKIHADHVRQQETVSENAMDNISDTLNLALVSFSPVWEDIAGNLSRLDGIAGRIFSSGETGGTDILVFPEAFATGFSMTPEITQEYGGSGIVGWMKDTARMYGCAVAGSVYVSDGSSGRPVRYNRFCFAMSFPMTKGISTSVRKAEAVPWENPDGFSSGRDGKLCRESASICAFRAGAAIPRLPHTIFI